MATPDPSVRLTRPVFRAHNPEWAWSPVSGEGARLHGGRFNPIGVPALYTSLTELTAIREASPLGRPMQPLTLCQYKVDCDRLLDSRDEDALKKNGVTREMIACPNWRLDMFRGVIPDSHRVSTSLIVAGYRGIIAPCFAAGADDGDINVVFWDWSDAPPNLLRVIDDYQRLPLSRNSWH